ncbi:transposase, partial [Rhodococcus sp. NPDC127530]
MYLRETRRKNKDGSVVSYLQLAHNERHPDTGSPTAKVIHNFGRAETVDRDGLARLVSSISRFLAPDQSAAASTAGGEV